MNDIKNLTEGKIRGTLIKLALPTMGTGFIQMAYNLTDILWLGRLSTEAVAAAGAAGFFLWLATSLAIMVGAILKWQKSIFQTVFSWTFLLHWHTP